MSENNGKNRAGVGRYDAPDSPTSVGWTTPRCERLATRDDPMRLEAGGTVGPVDVEFETYGKLNPARDNVIFITHGLSGDAHVAGWDATAADRGRQWRERKPGWWDNVVGPGKPLDTDHFFVVCSNVLGSCYGTLGPSSTGPETGKPYGLSFPMVTVGDWVRLQARLLDALGIERIHAVVGGSLGGQQALEWALAFPERVERCIVLAASAKLSPQALAFNAVGRHAIMRDPNFNDGDYYGSASPSAGLAVARMLAHITYLSDQGMRERFGRRLHDKEDLDFEFGVEYQVESYLHHQGRSFVQRFDANSYLYISRAMDYYDAAARWGDDDLVKACGRIQSKTMVASFSSDWLYPPDECRELALAISRAGKTVTYVNIESSYGHDAFLVENDQLYQILRGFLAH